jgi:hypothetical protein
MCLKRKACQGPVGPGLGRPGGLAACAGLPDGPGCSSECRRRWWRGPDNVARSTWTPSSSSSWRRPRIGAERQACVQIAYRGRAVDSEFTHPQRLDSQRHRAGACSPVRLAPRWRQRRANAGEPCERWRAPTPAVSTSAAAPGPPPKGRRLAARDPSAALQVSRAISMRPSPGVPRAPSSSTPGTRPSSHGQTAGPCQAASTKPPPSSVIPSSANAQARAVRAQRGLSAVHWRALGFGGVRDHGGCWRTT